MSIIVRNNHPPVVVRPQVEQVIVRSGGTPGPRGPSGMVDATGYATFDSETGVLDVAQAAIAEDFVASQSIRTIETMTRAEWDAMDPEDRDPNTVYLVKE